jgi:hypothetical protein
MRRVFGGAIAGAIILSLLGAPNSVATAKLHTFTAEIWADNWFALYVNGKKVGEDSIPFATEKSFNGDEITFKASYPLTIGIIARDYVENGSGLEYIGRPNQQIGDGGIIAQIRDTSSGQVVTATNKSWKVFITNTAPLNVECVKSSNPLKDCKSIATKAPSSWYSSTYKDSAWKYATEFTPAEVGVKDGYFKFSWSDSSSLVWSSDLKLDNTILLRNKIQSAPKITQQP